MNVSTLVIISSTSRHTAAVSPFELSDRGDLFWGRRMNSEKWWASLAASILFLDEYTLTSFKWKSRHASIVLRTKDKKKSVAGNEAQGKPG